MEYVQEIMPSVWDCVSYPKTSQGRRVAPEKQTSLATEYHSTQTLNSQGDFHLAVVIPDV